jgi:ABC-type transporter Mla subunit MlaD
MQDNIITWNLANWVSIVLMALVGFFIVGGVVAMVKRKQGGGGGNADPAVSA